MVAVNSVTFSIKVGEIFGVLGPNGAGKTTLVRLLNGVLTPSGGRALVIGLDPVTQGTKVRKLTGVLTEAPAVYERLTARENLLFFGALYQVPPTVLPRRVEKLLATFGLSERADDKVGAFSKGMKQRLALARTLIHDPPLLFLDEPTAGLDPEVSHQVNELIKDLKQSGHTVFLCTHNLAEAQHLCDRVAVLNRGHLLALGTPVELERKLWPASWVDLELWALPPENLISSLRAIPGVKEVVLNHTHLAVQVNRRERIPYIVAEVARRGGQILRVNPRERSLEEIYLELQQRYIAQAGLDGSGRENKEKVVKG